MGVFATGLSRLGVRPNPGITPPAPSTATAPPAYQPFGLMRERSQSFDPASFLRRQAFGAQRQLVNQAYGQRALEARAAAGQAGAQAGLTGGAGLAAQNEALRNVLLGRAQEMGQL